MLQAIIQKKSSRWLKQAQQENLQNPSHTPREDKITSTVFGPMQYLNSVDVYLFFCKLIGKKPETTIENISHTLSFWERKSHSWPSSDLKCLKTTEPDLIVRFQINQQHITFIVELKWGKSSHFHSEQLERQWSQFQEGETHLIYLATHIHPDFFNKKDFILNQQYWHDITWAQFLGFTQREAYQHTTASIGFIRYMNDVSKLLTQLNLKQFNCFSKFNVPLTWGQPYQIIQLNQFNIPKLKIEWTAK